MPLFPHRRREGNADEIVPVRGESAFPLVVVVVLKTVEEGWEEGGRGLGRELGRELGRIEEGGKEDWEKNKDYNESITYIQLDQRHRQSIEKRRGHKHNAFTGNQQWPNAFTNNTFKQCSFTPCQKNQIFPTKKTRFTTNTQQITCNASKDANVCVSWLCVIRPIACSLPLWWRR